MEITTSNSNSNSRSSSSNNNNSTGTKRKRSRDEPTTLAFAAGATSKEEEEQQHQQQQQPPSFVLSTQHQMQNTSTNHHLQSLLHSELGFAVSVALLLSDWDKYGLTERVCYHFELSDALVASNENYYSGGTATAAVTATATAGTSISGSSSSTLEQRERSEITNEETYTSCRGGVLHILDCVPTKQWHKITRRQKRYLRIAIRNFNQYPTGKLPLKLNPQTRVFFAYETTRIALCLDASPTLTSTFGFSNTYKGSHTGTSISSCCPLDRFVEMTQQFWHALIAPVLDRTDTVIWQPHLAVTVLAVFPRASTGQCTNVLVRDYRCYNTATATILVQQIQEWCYSEIESQLAQRLSNHELYSYNEIPLHASSLRDLMQAGEAALSTLSSAARPLIVVATDSRSVACDRVIDVVTDTTTTMDTPVIVLDLSSPTSHTPATNTNASTRNSMSWNVLEEHSDIHWLNHDPWGAPFPLHLSDDSEAVYRVCMATGGTFLDASLLRECVTIKAGQVPLGNVLEADTFFAFKRHSVQPNALQWYLLMSLSPLSPILHTGGGTLPPPAHVEPQNGINDTTRLRNQSTNSTIGIHNSDNPFAMAGPAMVPVTGTTNKPTQIRTTFSTYIINPIPIKEVLLMRVKEGYRARQYGQATSDRVSIHFVSELDLGTTIHYELSYKALPDTPTRMVGSAHIKIELSGDAKFVGSVKNDFLHPLQSGPRPVMTMAQQVSARLCTHLRWIRKEDMLQSYLSPLKWSDQLSSPDTPFVRRLGSLSVHQRRRHFCLHELDVVLTGRMPWDIEKDKHFSLLGDFCDTDDGEQQLIEAVENWSTQTIQEGRQYVRQTPSAHGLAGYCVVEVLQSSVASRVYTVVTETFGGMSANHRLALEDALREVLRPLPLVEVLPKKMASFLVGETARQHVDPERRFYQSVLEGQHNHASWDLVKDPELLPLLMKRRKEIGDYYLMDSSDEGALFARLFRERNNDSVKDPGNLAQYQLSIQDDKTVVYFNMESEGGMFFPLRQCHSQSSQFHNLVRILRTRDQECGHALRCRTTLLQIFEDKRLKSHTEEAAYLPCVQQLLAYASHTTLTLRFFHSGNGAANDILRLLTIDTLLAQSFGAKVAKIPLNKETIMEDLEPGDFFIAEFDKETLSILHLSQIDKYHVSPTDVDEINCRDLTFFTFGISDLYNIRDEVADEASDDDHISEYIFISEFSDSVLSSHALNYSAAAYRALNSDAMPLFEGSFNVSDFAEVVRPLEFVEVARVMVAQCVTSDRENCALLKLLETVLHTISGQTSTLYYANSQENDIAQQFEDSDAASEVYDEINEQSLKDVDTYDDQARQSIISFDDDIRTDDGSLDFHSADLDMSVQRRLVEAPIFVRFFLNENLISTDDLCKIDHSSSLAVLVSVFKTKDTKPTEVRKAGPSDLHDSHLSAALDLSSLLNAFVAEQNLERLRHHGTCIGDEDIHLAKNCMRKARNILSSILEIFFYAAKTDLIVPASAPSGHNAEVAEGFNLLASELNNVKSMRFRRYGSGDNLLVETVTNGGVALAYWCFVKIRRNLGVVSVDIHHPDGSAEASHVLQTILYEISSCCHRVNQMVLLRSLHCSRNASSFLIPPDESDDMQKTSERKLDRESSPFPDGIFRCPTVYRTSFELYHRCATNPKKVARALESTVLHIFALSNRTKFFVYKDESGAVFYMRLSIVESVDTEAVVSGDNESGIDLVVHGIDKPGPSITVQLKTLLQKKLLSIAVDMLSSVLIKNPQYHWKQSDITFVRNYQYAWTALENNPTSNSCPIFRLYGFPVSEMIDPGMIMLYFRQNICGSTFFHPLRTSEWISDDSVNNEQSEKNNLHFNETDLVIYFNTAPSKLDKDFQTESTLTRRGAEFSRQTGSGIAIVEVSIVNRDGYCLRDLCAALPTEMTKSQLQMNESFMQFYDEDEDTSKTNPSNFFVRVKIIDTALNRSVLHQWVKLSLDQALSAWNIEKQLERMQRQLFAPILISDENLESKSTDRKKREQINRICPGLPALTSMLEFAAYIPDPGILKLECSGMVRSSSVALVALELLEKGILDHLRIETKKKVHIDINTQLCIIRSSRSLQPCRVTLEWQSRKKAVAKMGKEIVKDSPIDCPEYTIFFHSADYVDNRGDFATKIPKLFEEVLVSFGSSADSADSLKSLLKFKRDHLSHFRRSFAFIFSVKRNRRKLLTYNLNSKLFKSMAATLIEKNASFLASSGLIVASLQQRSLGQLAPKIEQLQLQMRHIRPVVNPKDKSASMNKGSTLSEHVNASGDVKKSEPAHTDNDKNIPPPPRVKRPQMIRRPKLVGKSVDGSAMQAMAMSRARASSTRFRGSVQGVGPSAVGVALKEEINGGRTPKPCRSSDARPPRIPPTADIQHADDKVLHKIKRAYEADASKQSLSQIPSLRAVSHRTLAHSVLFPQAQQDLSPSQLVADFVFSLAPIAWIDTSEMIQVPITLPQTFLLSVGHTICTWTPGLKAVPLSTTIKEDSPFYLIGAVKCVRSCKCFLMIKLSITTLSEGFPKKIILSEGRIFTLPRRKSGAPKNRTAVTQAWIESDSAGLDALAVETHKLLSLQSTLLDHAGYIVERTMKSGEVSDYRKVLDLLKILIDVKPLRQVVGLRSNYKFYQVSINLQSYNDRFIDRYEGPALFGWLSSNASKRASLLNCGHNGLCFKKEILVRATHSICFLSCDDTSLWKMKMSILCRTQKMDIREFIFREGSNKAISILDFIAVEAAGLAYKELRIAAESLQREKHWDVCSSNVQKQVPLREEINELLQLSSITSLASVIATIGEGHKLALMFKTASIIDVKTLCYLLKNDFAFLPFREISAKNDELVQHLFYLDIDDLFVLVKETCNDTSIHIDFVTREVPSNQSLVAATQKLTNFMLHYIWSQLAVR